MIHTNQAAFQDHKDELAHIVQQQQHKPLVLGQLHHNIIFE